MLREYEAMVVMPNELKEEDLGNVCNKIIDKIKELGGEVAHTKIWAREKAFAYPLRSRGAQKKKFTKGVYWLVNFSLAPSNLIKLKETIRLEESILRSLIVRINEKNKKDSSRNYR